VKFALLLVCCVVSSTVCKAAGREGVVRLNGRAGVAGETIRLSDLLPADAPANLRVAAVGVELGRSPQLGSRRTLSEEQITQDLKSHPEILARLFIPERVTVARRGWTIRPVLVKNAIRDFAEKQHWNLGPGDFGAVELSGNPQALTGTPALLVQNALQDSVRHRLQFVLRCADMKVCGSFLVSTAMPLSLSHVAMARQSLRRNGKTLARAGESALLSINGVNLRISLRVICLEPGLLGQTIRVRDANSRRIFRAEVVGSGALRASL
jgi:Chaperone for flagella basal body P-ring formation